MSAMPIVVLGIDPGITGGIAMLSGDDARVWATPSREVKINGKQKRRIDPYALARLLSDEALNLYCSEGDAVAFVERAQASPHMGVSSAFGYGEAFGLVVGVLAHLAVPIRFVTPQQWKRGMGLVKPGARELGRDEQRDKQPSLELARRLYPKLASDLARVKDNGPAEALLLAHWGCELLEGEQAGPLFSDHGRARVAHGA